MGTRITILLTEHGTYRVEQLIGRLKKFCGCYTVDYLIADYLIIGKSNKTISRFTVKDYCSGLTDIIDAIHIEPCDDVPIEQFKKDYGFVTGDEYIKKQS